MIKFDRFFGGVRKCITMSYDDGVESDKKLIEIFDKYNIRGTFHLNSGFMGTGNVIPSDEVSEVYKNHEVAVHGTMHHSLTKLPACNIVAEILEDRRALEKIVGYPVRGMSYANGLFNEEAVNAIHSCGISYARTANSIGGWETPENFLKWNPTCHHNGAMQIIDNFLNWDFQSGFLFYIWGHSFEFDRDNNWDEMEKLCQKIAGNSDIWYATNIEIYDYVIALKQLIVSVDNKIVINPTAHTLWFSCDGDVLKIEPGQTLTL